MDMNVSSLFESFESGAFSDLAWQPSGDAFWTIIDTEYSEGNYSSKSGLIDNNMTSDLSVTMDVVEDGYISFYKKVSCEDVGSYSGTYYDFLAFYIDEIEQAKWAGELDWSQSSFPVSAGQHTFMWQFIKDQGVVAGQDAVWIDNIIFPSTFNNSTMSGDVNNDSNINVQDIIVLVNMILSANYDPVGDVNDDGNIDVVDIIVVVNMILQN